jgi:hypothetical protein
MRPEYEAAAWLLDWDIQCQKYSKYRFKKSPVLTVNKQLLLLPSYAQKLLA